MNGLILHLTAGRAIVLLPGGEIVRVWRRRGWRVGMEVDPYGRSALLPRLSLAAAAVLLLAGAGVLFRTAGHPSDPVTPPLDAAKSASASLSPSAVPTLIQLTTQTPTPSPGATPSAGATPSPSPSVTPSASPSTTPTSTRMRGLSGDKDWDDDDDHDDDDDRDDDDDHDDDDDYDDD